MLGKPAGYGVQERTRARASRGNTKTLADFGCLNITFLVSFVPSSIYDRSISKHPILKPRRCTGTERCQWNEPVGPWRISGEADPLVYLVEVETGLVSYTSAVSSGKCDGTGEITRERKKGRRLRGTCGNLIPTRARGNTANLHRICARDHPRRGSFAVCK